MENIYKRAEKTNEYYEFSDGLFTYYVNARTGEKKFRLGKDDLLVKSNLDDFCRLGGANGLYFKVRRTGEFVDAECEWLGNKQSDVFGGYGYEKYGAYAEINSSYLF